MSPAISEWVWAEAWAAAVERDAAPVREAAWAAEREWDGALEALTDRAVVEEDATGASLARGVLHSYHRGLRARVLRHVLRRYGSTPDRAGTHAALEFISSGPSGGEIHLAGGIRLERDFDRIRIAAGPGAEVPDRPLVVPGAAAGTGRAMIGGRPVQVAWGAEAAPGAGITVPEPSFPLTVRGWRPGDRIRFAYGTKKLAKLFAEARLDRRARRRTPVVVDAAGRVLWVVGVARAVGVGEDDVGFHMTVEDVAGQR